MHLPFHRCPTSGAQRWQQNFRVNGFTVTAAGATGFFGWQVWESDRGGFIGLKIVNGRFIGHLKGNNPFLGGYVVFTDVFWLWLHDRATNVTERVGKH
jgi:hypothetical protein